MVSKLGLLVRRLSTLMLMTQCYKNLLKKTYSNICIRLTKPVSQKQETLICQLMHLPILLVMEVVWSAKHPATITTPQL